MENKARVKNVYVWIYAKFTHAQLRFFAMTFRILFQDGCCSLGCSAAVI